MFRRRGRPDDSDGAPGTDRSEAAQPVWRDRVDAARRLIEGSAASDVVGGRFADAVAALEAAERDRAVTDRHVAELDPERVTAELKAALRASPAGADEAHDRLVATMRARYEAVNAVIDRRDALGTAIDRAVADIELLAARSLTAGDPVRRAELDHSLDQLRVDLDALAEARREVASW